MYRKCDCCNNLYKVDPRNFNRGWGLTCSKSCAAKMRELRKRNLYLSPLQKKKREQEHTRKQEEAEKAHEFLGATEGLSFNSKKI